MRAIILAGGRGTRLRPYTVSLPKPLVPIGDRPILELILDQLRDSGFDHVTMAVNHMAEIIMAYFGDGTKWGVKIDYSIEDRPLSTIGPLTLVDDLPEDFLVMNGDLLTDISFSRLFTDHLQRKNDVTVAIFRRQQKIDFGVLEISGDEVVGFREKPVYDFDVSMGIYVINRRIVESLEKNQPYGFDNLMIDGIASERKFGVYRHDGKWLDIGRPDDYDAANNALGK